MKTCRTGLIQLIGTAKAALIIKNFFTYLPELAAFARDDEVWMAQQRLLSQNVRRVLPTEGDARCPLVRAQEQHLEGFALCGRLQAEPFASAGAIFVIIGGFQPFPFVVLAALQFHSATAQD